MCRHVWVAINDVRVCRRCGLTICALTGAVIFDRRLAGLRVGSGRQSGRAGNKAIAVDTAG